MIGRKLVLLRNGHILHKEETLFKAPFFEEWKHLTIKNIKKHGYAGLVATIRFYIQSSNLLKNKYQEAKIKIKNIRAKNLNSDSGEKREVSKFLKMISEYKHKIREIKHKIREEEDNL
jgi:hypothetical protein